MRKRLLLAATLHLAMSTVVLAQDRDVGKVADSSVGRAGQRQNNKAQGINAQPMTRINSRISNRIQLRVQNRIDRNYSASSGITSSYEQAGSRIRQSNTRAFVIQSGS